MKPIINNETAVRVPSQLNMLYDGAVLRSESLGTTVEIRPGYGDEDKWVFCGIRRLDADGKTQENKMWTVLSNAADWQIANELD